MYPYILQMNVFSTLVAAGHLPDLEICQEEKSAAHEKNQFKILDPTRSDISNLFSESENNI